MNKGSYKLTKSIQYINNGHSLCEQCGGKLNMTKSLFFALFRPSILHCL